MKLKAFACSDVLKPKLLNVSVTFNAENITATWFHKDATMGRAVKG
jgi:hypothetical protein